MENPNLKWMITRDIILGNFYIEALKKIKKCFQDGNYIDDVLFSRISKVSNSSSPLWGVAIHTFIPWSMIQSSAGFDPMIHDRNNHGFMEKCPSIYS